MRHGLLKDPAPPALLTGFYSCMILPLTQRDVHRGNSSNCWKLADQPRSGLRPVRILMNPLQQVPSSRGKFESSDVGYELPE